jgi:hypothetical protein
MSTYSPIASQTLSANATSVTFNNIPQGYTDLRIIFKGTATVGVGVDMRFNGDTSSNYNRAFMYSDGSGMVSSRGINQSSIDFTLLASRGHTIFDINNYSGSTNRKTALMSNDYYDNAVVRNVGVWRNTSPITSISFSVASENIASGTVISLYGLAGGQVSAKASGGVITTSGAYTIHTFTQSGGFIPNEDLTVDYLVVAGGGGGAKINGGGGAGGMRSTVTNTGGGGALETALSLTAGVTYPAIIGAGGSGGSINGTQGNNSVFATVTSIGGGFGGSYGSTQGITGGPGGSGGGGGFTDGAGNPASVGGTRTASPVQGFNGGPNSGSFTNSGGGGGAGAVGGTGTNSQSGVGGVGLASLITGASVTYAGGGGGGSETGSAGAGGAGGGGTGATRSGAAGSAGTANRGGGGGGGENNTPLNGYAGGSGIVIVRYLT